MAESDPNVFDIDISPEDREALDQWGIPRIVPAGQELPPGWEWREPEAA